jgi:hypothetical protein
MGRYNNALYKQHNESNLIRVIKASTVTWLGNLTRTDDPNPRKKVTLNQLYGMRRLEPLQEVR